MNYMLLSVRCELLCQLCAHVGCSSWLNIGRTAAQFGPRAALGSTGHTQPETGMTK